jgi:hypothetical protein
MHPALWKSRFCWLLRLGILSLLGDAILLSSVLLDTPVVFPIIGVLLFVPGGNLFVACDNLALERALSG